MTTFIEEASQILKSHNDYAILRDINKFSPAEMEVEFPDKLNHEQTITALLNLVSERIIGENITVTKTDDIQDGIDVTMLIQETENEVKDGQRTALYEGTKEQDGTPKQ